MWSQVHDAVTAFRSEIKVPAVKSPDSMVPLHWRFVSAPGWLNHLSIRSVFLVADAGAFANSGAEALLMPALKDRHVVRFSDFTANPKSEEIDRAVRAFRAGKFDLIVAVGGGSAIDVAKLTRACNRADAAADVIQQRAAVATDGPPLLAIPTTAGTGAEATHFSAVYVNGRKYSLADPSMRPQYVILDQSLLESLPREIMLSTGLDATCQAIESLWSTKSTTVSRRLAERALKFAWAALPACVSNPTPESRRKMLDAAHLAGQAIDISQTTACHALSYTLTSRFNIPHGQAVALMLAPVWAFNAAATGDDLADGRGIAHVRRVMRRLSRIIGAASPDQAPQAVRAHLSALGAAINFRQCNVPPQQAIDLVAGEIDPIRAGNNPRRLSPEQARQILQPLAA